MNMNVQTKYVEIISLLTKKKSYLKYGSGLWTVEAKPVSGDGHWAWSFCSYDGFTRKEMSLTFMVTFKRHSNV